MDKLPITTSVLMCHAPIVIPEIAGPEAFRCAKTTEGMRKVAAHVVATNPEQVVLISPHTIRHENEYSVLVNEPEKQTFHRFDHEEISVKFQTDFAFANAIIDLGKKQGFPIEPIECKELDHGVMVPLWFLQEAGLKCPVVVVSLPYYPAGKECEKLGVIIAAVIAQTGRRTAVVASGDMSHKLIPIAPASYHFQAHRFDRTFTEHIDRGEYKQAAYMDQRLRELAAEDSVDSTTIATAAVAHQNKGRKIISYEGPFGVGYLCAILFDQNAPAVKGVSNRELLRVARRAIESHLKGEKYKPVVGNVWADEDDVAGVFVTSWHYTHKGRLLRGCIGRFVRDFPTLEQEVADCAVQTATEDDRFLPLKEDELMDIGLEVSLLSKPEKISGPKELDPHKYGVIMQSAAHSATLLPNLEGIDTIDEQLEAVREKGKFGKNEPVVLLRYEVRKIEE